MNFFNDPLNMNNKKIICKKDLFNILLIIIISLFLRVPFLLKNINFNNDAPIYSENIENGFFDGNYNVQLPGYVSYIYLGRLINYFVKDTVFTQNIINIILVIFISIFFYLLLKIMDFSLLESFIYSIIFTLNSILLLGSLTGGNRLFLTLCSILLMILAIRIIKNDEKYLILVFALIYGVFVGFRQDLSINFLPLFIYLLYKIKNLKYFIFSVIIFFISCVVWFIPLMLEYGGVVSYLKLLNGSDTVKDTSIFFSYKTISPYLNILRIFLYLFNSFLFIFPFLIYSLIKKEFIIQKNLLIILVLSFFPAFIFQLLVHNGNFVQLASFMTPLFLFCIISFKLDNKFKLIYSIVIICLLFLQFYGVKMFNVELPKSVKKEYYEKKILNKVKNEKYKEILQDSYLKRGDRYYLRGGIIKYNKNKVEKIFYLSGYKYYKRIINVLILQYTYDGAKNNKTIRLKL